MQYPYEVVTNRIVWTGPNGTSRVGINIVDALPDAWFDTRLSGPANVASRDTEFGHDAEVFWRVSPAPPAGASYPLTVGGASLVTNAVAGRVQWSSTTWAGEDGVFGLQVFSSVPSIAASPAINIFTQAVRSLRIRTAGFTTAPVSAESCGSNCILPNVTFVSAQNSTINGGQRFLSTNTLTEFNLTVWVTDGAVPVLGDNASVVALTLNSNAASTVQLGLPPAYTEKGTMYARVIRGQATFRLGFTGSTMLAGGVEALATLTVSCPTTRPAHLLAPWESPANPCSISGSGATVSSQSFRVVEQRVTAEVLNSAAVTAAKSILKVASGLSSFSLFNITLFRLRLVGGLNRRNITYLNQVNIHRVIQEVVCTVNSMLSADGDLGQTVCGVNRVCAAPSNLASCPTGVVGCGCPAAVAKSLLLSRFLLQNGTSAPVPPSNATSTRSEFNFDLSRADGFPARTVDEVTAEYARVYAAALDALRNDEDLRDGFQITSVTERSATAIVTTTAPTTLPPTTPGPTNAPPPPPQPTPTPTSGGSGSSASPLAFAFAALLAALMALLA